MYTPVCLHSLGHTLFVLVVLSTGMCTYVYQIRVRGNAVCVGAGGGGGGGW